MDAYILESDTHTNTETTMVFLIMEIKNRSRSIAIIQKDLFILFVLALLLAQANVSFAANKNSIFNHFFTGFPLNGAHQNAEHAMSSKYIMSAQTCDAYHKPNPEHSVSGREW